MTDQPATGGQTTTTSGSGTTSANGKKKAMGAASSMAMTKMAMTPKMKAGFGLLGIVQLVFAFLAFWDLALRDAEEVRGPKPAWIPVILVNWIGPAVYFLFGIKHQDR